jgi:antitoxin VapB
MPDREQERNVSLFRNGANQALRIPRGFELPGTEATLTREGDALVIRPAKPRSLLALLKSLKPMRSVLHEPCDPPPESVDF